MALTGFPPNAQQIGTVEIGVYLTAEGTGSAYGLDGLGRAEALGHLMVVADRLRKEIELQWDTCPGCGLPYEDCADHDDDDDEESEDI